MKGLAESELCGHEGLFGSALPTYADKTVVHLSKRYDGLGLNLLKS